MYKWNGMTKHAVVEKLVNETSSDRETAKKVFEMLEQCKELKNDEYFQAKMEWPESSPGVMQLMIPTTRYYISLKRTTLYLAVLCCDVFRTKGAASLAVTFGGMLKQGIWEIKDREFCILRKMNKLKKCKRQEVVDLLPPIGEVCDEESEVFRCPYKNGNLCQISTKDIMMIIDKLVDKGVLFENEFENVFLNW